jgi:transposase
MAAKREGARDVGRKGGDPGGDGRGTFTREESREGGRGERREPQPPGTGVIRVVSGVERPDPEVVPQGRRRMFSAKYKLSILEKAEACTGPGDLGALLRREGLYSSNLRTWRRQRDQGSLQGLAPRRRGPPPDPNRELLTRVAKLENENRRLAEKLEKAELIIEVQKKVARLLGTEQPENRDGRG